MFGFITNCMYYLPIVPLIGTDSFRNFPLILGIQPEMTTKKEDKAP